VTQVTSQDFSVYRMHAQLLSNEFFPVIDHNAPKLMSAGDPTRELTALPTPLAGFKGPLRGRSGGKGYRGDTGEEDGREKGEVGGIAPWLLMMMMMMIRKVMFARSYS